MGRRDGSTMGDLFYRKYAKPERSYSGRDFHVDWYEIPIAADREAALICTGERFWRGLDCARPTRCELTRERRQGASQPASVLKS